MAQRARKTASIRVVQSGWTCRNTHGRVPFVGARGASLPSRARHFFDGSTHPAALHAWI